MNVNNLYGWAMSQYLPAGNFKWLSHNSLDVTKIPDDSKIEYILEVDLHYPEEIHDKQRDLPLCPKKSIPPGSKHEKLLATLCAKEKYVIYY